MVDRLPEFQGPKYAGSFRRGDFADFHQRFSLVPRRCAGKYPPAAREIRADSWALQSLGNAYPGHPPQRNRSSMRRSAYPKQAPGHEQPVNEGRWRAIGISTQPWE